MTMKEILETLDSDHSAMICKPATDPDIEQCQKDLEEMALEPLPDDYIDFLKTTNGFAWNGIEFFSTYRVTDPDSRYTLMDLVSMNDEFNELYELDDYVYLGRADDDYYVFDIENENYHILELSSRESMEEFETFEELFADTVGGRLGSVLALAAEDENEE